MQVQERTRNQSIDPTDGVLAQQILAGDQVAFECTPPPESGFGWLHEHMLAALGCPIGGLFDTETLAGECEMRKRYSFFFTSAPLHVPGGVDIDSGLSRLLKSSMLTRELCCIE